MTFEITPIGTVKNAFLQPADIREPDKTLSRIEINPELAAGLYKIEDQSHIEVIFYFHQSREHSLHTRTFTGEERGLFATRSPHRLNRLGNTTVKFERREGNSLWVRGLDAIDGTPVIDIKPANSSLLTNPEEQEAGYTQSMRNNPRFSILMQIKDGETDKLLLRAGQLHGHYCPGLALGVMAARHAMMQVRGVSDGMEDLLAIVETNSCFTDGVQFLTGCSVGNNALIYKDFGKVALTLISRKGGEGVRIVARNHALDRVKDGAPDFRELFRKVVEEQSRDKELLRAFKQSATRCSFETLKIPFDELFKTKPVQEEIPEYAPIMESLICEQCGEAFMASKAASGPGVPVCRNCSSEAYPFLDGRGINSSG